MGFEDVATGLDRDDEAVGEVTRLHSGDEVGNQLVPGIGRDPTVDIAVDDDLDLTLAERDEEQHAVAVVRGADDANGELAMGEPARVAVLDRCRHDAQAQR